MNCPIKKTGGQIDDMLMSLVEAASDKEESVQNVIESSIVEIGKKQPGLVLTSCSYFLASHSKLSQSHRIVLLNAVDKVVKESMHLIEDAAATCTIRQAFVELTSTKDVVQDARSIASSIIVSLSEKFCHEVMSELLERFQPAVLPHYYVVETLGSLSTTNIFGMVPYLKACLGTCLLTLPLVKSDCMRCVFAKMLANFSEAILEYVANIDMAPDKNVTKEFFHDEIYAAWEVLFNNWLGSKDTKVRGAVVVCLGRMSYVMSSKKLQECLPKLIPSVSSLYKKQQDANIITEGLYFILDASVTEDHIILEPFVDSLLVAFFQQACLPVNLSSSASVKNHNEVLRCFSVLAKSFPERVVSFILAKLEPPNERSRIGSLDVIQHLVNYAGENFRDKEKSILSGLKHVTNDSSNKVKRMLAQTIIKIAHHGYLELEEGESLVEFIIKQCSISSDSVGNNSTKKSSDPDFVTSEMLRSFCENILHLLSTTVTSTTETLWPYLLTFTTKQSYTEAFPTICRAVGSIALRKKQNEDPDYFVDFEREVDVPKPPALFVRMIVLLGYPEKEINKGSHIITALNSLAPLIRPNFAKLWQAELKNLSCFLSEADVKEPDIENFQLEWDKKLSKFFGDCLEEVDNDGWATSCGEELIKQINLYAQYPDDKIFWYKCLGVAMSKSTKDEFVTQAVDILFNETRHSIEQEREACARAIGIAASTHVDLVLNKLDLIYKAKKASFIMNFFKEAIGDMEERIKATILLSYGYIALHAPIDFLQTRLDSSIVTVVNQNICQVKDPVIKLSMVRSMQLVAAAVSSDSIGISFTSRNSLLTHLKNLMKHASQTALTNEIRAQIITASSALVKLHPVLTASETQEIFALVVSRVIFLPAELTSSSTANNTTPTVDEQQRYNELLTDCMDKLTIFAKDLLDANTTPDTFVAIFAVLRSSIISTQESQRIRSLQIFKEVTRLFHRKINVALVNQMTNLGYIIATMVPRCSDQIIQVRLLAVDCIETLLKIGLRYEGRSPDYRDEHVDKVPKLRENITKTDAVAMFAAITDLSLIFNQKIGIDNLFSYIEGLLEGLTDLQTSGSSAACLTLSKCIKGRGSELHGMVEKVFAALISKIPELTNPQTTTGALRALRYLTFHHLLKVISLMLEERVPFSELTCDVWRDLGQDNHIMPSILDHLLEMLSRSQPFEEPSNQKGREAFPRRALPLPLAITCALTEILKPVENHMTVVQNYPQLVTQMLVQVASMTSTKSPRSNDKIILLFMISTMNKYDIQIDKQKNSKIKPSNQSSFSPVFYSIEGLKQVIISSKSKSFMDQLNVANMWEMFASDDQDKLYEGLTLFARCFIQCQSEMLPKIVNHLNPLLSSLYVPQRVMAAVMFAEFINNKCGNDYCIVDMLVNCLVGRLVDTDRTVRRFCIRGLGNIASCGHKLVQKYCTMLLSSLMAGLDDKDDSTDVITLEAMEGLSKVTFQLEEEDIKNILINVALRIRPCFEKDRASVRVASLMLFGDLAQFGSGECKEPFLEQIHSNFVTILLHLNDPDPSVKQASKYCLRKIGPLVGSEEINEMFQKHLIDDASLKYSIFMNDLCKVIVSDLSEKLNYYIMGILTYFKSNSPPIRGSAATFVGFLLGNLPDGKTSSVSMEQSCKALMNLLRDDDADVRAKTAEAIGLLHDL